MRLETVTPFAGVWIEIVALPPVHRGICVTPFAGVWIEIIIDPDSDSFSIVTPFAGVWIEIGSRTGNQTSGESLPSRECGLKCYAEDIANKRILVTPFAGVWIEIRWKEKNWYAS